MALGLPAEPLAAAKARKKPRLGASSLCCAALRTEIQGKKTPADRAGSFLKCLMVSSEGVMQAPCSVGFGILAMCCPTKY